MADLPPAKAVQEALGLSNAEAQQLSGMGPMGFSGFINSPFESLAALVALVTPDGGKIILQIKNPDGSTFKEWTVTAEGYLIDEDSVPPQAEASPDEPEAHPS